jgi:hypothetical protein
MPSEDIEKAMEDHLRSQKVCKKVTRESIVSVYRESSLTDHGQTAWIVTPPQV